MNIETLSDYFSKTKKNLLELFFCFNNLKRLDEYKYENEDWAKNHPFFSQYKKQLIYIMSIELSKLLDNNDNQRYNFLKFFNKLKNEGYDKALLKKSTSSMNTFKNKIEVIKKINFWHKKIIEHSDNIQDILELRNKVYAHTDTNTESLNIYLQMHHFEELINLCYNIHKDLFMGFFEMDVILNHRYSNNLDFIIHMIALNKPKR